ncbi:hypothetical protein L2E82_45452 [Cichorium intybus]|uniref:Uncharacterized protein n=1 Tax=Cichorium intybus TaxID=13427 RepID=A0ACB8ZS54_CICIN|nr:hypothetical protein L2E82_45452 [Cichorium intybus]
MQRSNHLQETEIVATTVHLQETESARSQTQSLPISNSNHPNHLQETEIVEAAVHPPSCRPPPPPLTPSTGILSPVQYVHNSEIGNWGCFLDYVYHDHDFEEMINQSEELKKDENVDDVPIDAEVDEAVVDGSPNDGDDDDFEEEAVKACKVISQLWILDPNVAYDDDFTTPIPTVPGEGL